MSSRPTLLVVDDQRGEREALARLLRLSRYEVCTAADANQALSYLTDHVDLIISDLRMDGTSGLDLLRTWKERSPLTPFILITAYGQVDTAVNAMKLGAEEYLRKPVNPEELLILVQKCLEVRRKDQTIRHLEERLDRRRGFENIVGTSKAMLDVFDQTKRAAQVESTVLVTGESGTGKELIAEAIHMNSNRRENPFVVVNITAVPDSLIESELFGHVKGAFTGADAPRIGRFEAASSGTLFIDEIGDLKQPSQAKLLRVLENHRITRLGSNEDREVDVRVVAATSRNLEKMVAAGEFREDLYYRLNVVRIALPPVRRRREDIPLLVRHFLNKIGPNVGKPEVKLDPALMHFLEMYEWPGNVRQLRNCIESMVVLAHGNTITLDDLPVTMHNRRKGGRPRFNIPQGMTLRDLERMSIRQTLDQCAGDCTRAAKILGVSVRTLQRKKKSWRNGHVGDSQAVIAG